MQEGHKMAEQVRPPISLTNAVSWRGEGIVHKKNEIFLDIVEKLNLLVASNGSVLRSEIIGAVKMKSFLSGMPELKLGLNDKVMFEVTGRNYTRGKAIEMEDIKFHQCVRLARFENDRTISFIPPDGEFELMRYRVKSPSQPFRIISNLQEEGKTKLMVNIKVNADFSIDNKASNVIIKIPMPPTAASALITAAKGRAKYVPGERAILWNISSFPGQTETSLIAIVDLLPATREKAWVKPPISMDFKIPMYSASGVYVRFLKVYEKSSYKTERWVQYLSQSGEYQVRL